MCFVLYISSDTEIPEIPFDPDAPALNTQPLSGREQPLRDLFSHQHVKFLGSSSHCGCGYRHLSYQNGEWPEESLIGTDLEFGSDTQGDHESLHQFLQTQLQYKAQIELYGCRDGEFREQPARHETIVVDDLLGKDFFLRERCHYTVARESPAEPN